MYCHNRRNSASATVINRQFQNGEITCRCLSKRHPDNSTIFAAEATTITLALDYYQHMEPVRHDVVVYSDSMSWLRGKTLRTLSSAISWPSCGYWVIKAHMFASAGYQAIMALRKLTSWPVSKAVPWPWHWRIGKSPLCRYKAINIQQLVQIKWDVSVHGRNLSLEANTRSTQEISVPK